MLITKCQGRTFLLRYKSKSLYLSSLQQVINPQGIKNKMLSYIKQSQVLRNETNDRYKIFKQVFNYQLVNK